MNNQIPKNWQMVVWESIYKTVYDLGKFFTPIIYAFAWLVILSLANRWLPIELIANDNFLIVYTLVFLFILITKSTSWSIGHEKFGIKGDSQSRVINYHSNDLWFDLFADNPELIKEEKVQKFIKEITNKK